MNQNLTNSLFSKILETLLLIFPAIQIWNFNFNDKNIANVMNTHCHVEFTVVRH